MSCPTGTFALQSGKTTNDYSKVFTGRYDVIIPAYFGLEVINNLLNYDY